jgi:hypothetical protein
MREEEREQKMPQWQRPKSTYREQKIQGGEQRDRESLNRKSSGHGDWTLERASHNASHTRKAMHDNEIMIMRHEYKHAYEY